jgi:hypothetical protein
VGDGSGDYSGDLGSWCCLTADETLGLVYVPLSAPTGVVYGGHRPGDNLFSDTLVAIDAATGERVWHFQMVHHDVWDYEPVESRLTATPERAFSTPCAPWRPVVRLGGAIRLFRSSEVGEARGLLMSSSVTVALFRELGAQ